MCWDIETKDGFVPDAVEARIDRVYNEFLNELENDMIKAVDDAAPACLWVLAPLVFSCRWLW